MKKAFLLVYLMLITQNLIAQSEEVVCSISTIDSILNVGETPKIKIVFKNNTEKPIYLIKSLDASSYKWRYPYTFYTIEKLNDKNYKKKELSRCGNLSGIDISDFVEIKGNDKLDRRVVSDYAINNSNNFKDKGKYKITFHYSTKSEDLADYMGEDMSLYVYDLKFIEGDSQNPSKLLNVVRDEYKDMVNKIEQLFSNVPKVEITSNSLIVEVR